MCIFGSIRKTCIWGRLGNVTYLGKLLSPVHQTIMLKIQEDMIIISTKMKMQFNTLNTLVHCFPHCFWKKSLFMYCISMHEWAMSPMVIWTELHSKAGMSEHMLQIVLWVGFHPDVWAENWQNVKVIKWVWLLTSMWLKNDFPQKKTDLISYTIY